MRRLLAVAFLLVPSVARAGALDRFESPHKSSSSSSSSSSGSTSSSSSSSSCCTSSSSESSSSSSASSGSRGALPPELLLAFFPNLWGAAFAPPNRPTLDPYAGSWIDTRPIRDEDGTSHPPVVDESRLRHIELTTSGFLARNEAVFAHTMGLRVFLGQVVAIGAWDRLYETPPDAGALARLDLYHLHFTSNLLGGSARTFELLPLMGLGVMHGRETTGAFDLGLDMRLYPARPLTLAMSSVASLFAHGPALFDSRFEAGVSIDRFELRGGLRWLYQYKAQGFVGPVASVVVRL